MICEGPLEFDSWTAVIQPVHAPLYHTIHDNNVVCQCYADDTQSDYGPLDSLSVLIGSKQLDSIQFSSVNEREDKNCICQQENKNNESYCPA